MAGHACASLRILRMVTLSRWITKEGEHSNPVLRSFIASTRHGLFFCNTSNTLIRDSQSVHKDKGRISEIRLSCNFNPRGYGFIPMRYEFNPKGYEFIPRDYGFIPRDYEFIPRGYEFIPRDYEFIPRGYEIIRLG